MVWEINMGVCPRLDFENIMLFNCLGYNFNIYGAFEFLCNSIANLWRHEWYHYNTLGNPVIIISKVIDICNEWRNVLSNSYIIHFKWLCMYTEQKKLRKFQKTMQHKNTKANNYSIFIYLFRYMSSVEKHGPFKLLALMPLLWHGVK